MLVDICSDHAQTSRIIRLAVTQLVLPRHHVKINPGAVLILHHALRTENGSIVVRLAQSL